MRVLSATLFFLSSFLLPTIVDVNGVFIDSANITNKSEPRSLALSFYQ